MNGLPTKTRSLLTVSEFKNALHIRNDPQILFYYGERWASVHHARLRIGCSKLKFDLCNNLHVIRDSACSCGIGIENAEHFFFYCPHYPAIRATMVESIMTHCECNLHNVLFGNPNLSLDSNKLVFEAVHKFIIESGRFN